MACRRGQRVQRVQCRAESRAASRDFDRPHSSDVTINGGVSGTAPIETCKSSIASSHERYYPGELVLPFGTIKDEAIPKESGIVKEYKNSALPGPSQGSVSLHKKVLEIQLPEEDNLFTMNDPLGAQRPEYVQVLGPDALGSHSMEQRYQVESYNLYHILHDPAARHLIMQHISMHGSFPPDGLPRGVPPSQPVRNVLGYRPKMSNVNNLHMHPRQPNYGEFGLMMADK
ncbi:hypothetical protein GUJ93_ZPchr0001g31419 [Zizania palustris]|uniref:Uncharacterized protein n=1 Tax=Zizania palustris TaxID=103762 RepID=A0A8J5RVX5_ZIZPA|nr:hypothetical protein GUJ93_ZPchr0001g31419 [Zizania palustris]